MLKYNLKDFIRGWFVGNFSPSIIKTDQVEVACKTYSAGDYENKHHHKVATEITLIVSGSVLMNGVEYKTGDIIEVLPGESTDFKVLTDTVTVCVKVPCVSGDKYND